MLRSAPWSEDSSIQSTTVPPPDGRRATSMPTPVPRGIRKRTTQRPYVWLTSRAIETPPETHAFPNRGSRYVWMRSAPDFDTTCDLAQSESLQHVGTPWYSVQVCGLSGSLNWR
jgi:hypothetical protein